MITKQQLGNILWGMAESRVLLKHCYDYLALVSLRSMLPEEDTLPSPK
jgi:hypothetical protein